MSDKVKKFISDNWDRCIKRNRENEGTLIGMPYPYTVPAVGHFDEIYYWDTYFTNKGLLLDGRAAQAKYNVDDMMYLVNRYGFMPNGNRTYYLTHSQPPFLSCMVRDIYDYYKDDSWLYLAYHILEKEYEFWHTKRNSDIGLSHYDSLLTNEKMYLEMAEDFERRAEFMPDAEVHILGRHYRTTAESGWDITPRWDYDAFNFAAVDLNSLLFMMESNMSFFASELQNGEEQIWQDRADKRKELMLENMDDGSGLLLDYNFITGKLSNILSAASFYPMFSGVAKSKNALALVKALDRLETEYGILACEKNDAKGTYQWNYPNGWACLQYVAIMGLDKYGYKTEAKRIAEKYIRLVDKTFEETGNLWEKYNVVSGGLDVANEYKMPAMMGWSAGVYLAADDYLKK